MIRFRFKDNGVTSLETFGSLMELIIGATFLCAELYHKIPDADSKEIFREEITKAVQSGFCWSDKTNLHGEGCSIIWSELIKQAREAEHDSD